MQLSLNEDHCKVLGDYVSALERAHILLSDASDTFVWDKTTNGKYNPKVGYLSISVDPFIRVVKWWWRGIWKVNCLSKNKLFGWDILENKVLTWDKLQKCNFEGSGWCSLYKNVLESSIHLFLLCPFSLVVWKEVLLLLNLHVEWRGITLDEAFLLS